MNFELVSNTILISTGLLIDNGGSYDQSIIVAGKLMFTSLPCLMMCPLNNKPVIVLDNLLVTS